MATLITWTATIGGIGSCGVQTGILLEPLPIDPNAPHPERPPNRARISFIPQVFEDLIITVLASDGFSSHSLTFPLSVVNYPVTNHPPIIVRSNLRSKFLIEVGKRFTYQVKAYDQDENDVLTFFATLQGMASYQYGPWAESIIDPKTGLIDFTPQFADSFELIVSVRDNRGMWSVTSYGQLCACNTGTWLNHPPISTSKPRFQRVCRAGQTFTYQTNFKDIDGDSLYYTSNFGIMSEDGVFQFSTHFPGGYEIIITAYDIRGGTSSVNFHLCVQPWWAL